MAGEFCTCQIWCGVEWGGAWNSKTVASAQFEKRKKWWNDEVDNEGGKNDWGMQVTKICLKVSPQFKKFYFCVYPVDILTSWSGQSNSQITFQNIGNLNGSFLSLSLSWVFVKLLFFWYFHFNFAAELIPPSHPDALMFSADTGLLTRNFSRQDLLNCISFTKQHSDILPALEAKKRKRNRKWNGTPRLVSGTSGLVLLLNNQHPFRGLVCALCR